IDDQLTFTSHIASVSRSCRFALYNIRKIRLYLTQYATRTSCPNGPAGLRGETTTDDPERGGASGVHPTEKGTRHPATHSPPLSACSCSHYVQVTYACLQSAYWFCSHLPKCSCKGKCYTKDAALV